MPSSGHYYGESLGLWDIFVGIIRDLLERPSNRHRDGSGLGAH